MTASARLSRVLRAIPAALGRIPLRHRHGRRSAQGGIVTEDYSIRHTRHLVDDPPEERHQ